MEAFNELKNVLEKTQELHTNTLKKIAQEIISCYKQGGKIIVLGNGGSYADSLHFAAELEGAYKNRARSALSALVPANPAALTAVGNDFGYDHTFRKFVEANAQPQDIVIGLSTSGNSMNVVLALEEARKKSAKTIAFTGESGGKMKDHADILFNIPSNDTARIQEVQHFGYHEICDLVESTIFRD